MDSERGLGFERGLVVAVRIAEDGSKGGDPGGAGASPGNQTQPIQINVRTYMFFWIRIGVVDSKGVLASKRVLNSKRGLG